MTYFQTYTRLALASLTPEQHEKTCGYWYTVNNAGTPHTAFRTRAALDAWLELAGLELSADLPEQGVASYQSLLGSYQTALTFDLVTFWALPGERFRSLSNGTYTLGIATADAITGTRTLWTINPNVPRPFYDYRQSQGAIDLGDYSVNSLPIPPAGPFHVLGTYADGSVMVLELDGYASRERAARAIAWQETGQGQFRDTRWDIAERIGPDVFRTEAGKVVTVVTRAPYTESAWAGFVGDWRERDTYRAPVLHYMMTLDEHVAARGSYVDPSRYVEGGRDYHPEMLCRTGDGHAKGTRDRDAVTCGRCKARLAKPE